MSLFFSLLSTLCSLYTLVLVARAIFDLVMAASHDWYPSGALLVIANAIYAMTDPPLRFLGKYIPPLRFGGMALDMGFLVLFFGVQILQSIFIRLV
ncbi:MAG: YggT family protein [Ancrocorticia sp.]|jgi:YggT family protein|nr:YggT family protein [Ancrocorticia sp.]MCI2193375.1 YggT family protein [Ancrocorticia sp.]MCI2198197.1 YggT family protein [Ancrocorticia sp.]